MVDYKARVEQLGLLLDREGLDVCVLLPGSTFSYCTGRQIMLDAVTTVGFFFGRDSRGPDRPLFLVPEFELSTFEDLIPFDAEIVPYQRNQAAYAGAIASMVSRLDLAGGRIGADSGALRLREVLALQSVLPSVHIAPIEGTLAELRLCKGEEEISSILRAIRATENALEASFMQIVEGLTEKDVRRLVETEILRSGADGMAFDSIVVSGPRSALQHASPGDCRIRAGDCLILDVGARCDGYCADITRTVSIGYRDQLAERAHAVVLEANQAARNAVRPGVAASSVDAAARDVIDASEFRGCLIHGTGHGLGLDIHEPPMIAPDVGIRLQPGMVFTIEPGIYIEHAMGVRIEDVVVVTETGCECLTTLDRQLRVL